MAINSKTSEDAYIYWIFSLLMGFSSHFCFSPQSLKWYGRDDTWLDYTRTHFLVYHFHDKICSFTWKIIFWKLWIWTSFLYTFNQNLILIHLRCEIHLKHLDIFIHSSSLSNIFLFDDYWVVVLDLVQCTWVI